MSEPLTIDRAQARRFLLQHQHLLTPRKLTGKQGVMDFIRKVNCIQYDPINIVGQNPHLVLQSRVRNYQPAMLDSLLYEDRKLSDGFDKVMSIFPMEDWPDFAYWRANAQKEYSQDQNMAAAVKLSQRLLEEIEARGPMSSIDFKEDETRMDWWLTASVRTARVSMEYLFYIGKTVVHHRTNTRRYYDLTERVLPPELTANPRQFPSQADYMDWHVYRRAGGLGLVHDRIGGEFGGMVGWRGGHIKAAMLRLVEQGRLLPVTIQGLERYGFYIREQDKPALEAAAKAPRAKPAATFIAPLDNLMWDRRLDSMLFDFDYTWEVYIPEAKRKYGYYVLPVLYGERFIARIDPYFDRATQTLTVKGWWWENGVDKKDEAVLAALQDCFAAFARHLGAKGIALAPGLKEPVIKKVIQAAGA